MASAGFWIVRASAKQLVGTFSTNLQNPAIVNQKGDVLYPYYSAN